MASPKEYSHPKKIFKRRYCNSLSQELENEEKEADPEPVKESRLVDSDNPQIESVDSDDLQMETEESDDVLSDISAYLEGENLITLPSPSSATPSLSPKPTVVGSSMQPTIAPVLVNVQSNERNKTSTTTIKQGDMFCRVVITPDGVAIQFDEVETAFYWCEATRSVKLSR